MKQARHVSRDGYILIAVLGVMMLLTSLLTAGSLLIRSTLDTVRIGDTDLVMSGLARGGIELTAYQLFVVKGSLDTIDGRRIRLGGGIVVPHVSDEAGKVDLNASDPMLLDAVFRRAGLDARMAAELVAYVLDMRGARHDPSDPNASPAPAGHVSDQPTAAAGETKTKRGFQSVDQLRDFQDLTQSDLRALRPLLTVFNPDGKINVMSASRDVLLGLPGVSPAGIEVMLADRDRGDTRAIEGLLAQLGDAKPFAKMRFGPAFDVRVDAFSAEGRKTSVHAVLAASNSLDDPYYVLDYRE